MVLNVFDCKSIKKAVITQKTSSIFLSGDHFSHFCLLDSHTIGSIGSSNLCSEPSKLEKL